MNAELEQVLIQRGGLFWLDGQHAEWTHGVLNTIVTRLSRHRDSAEQILYSDKPRPIEFGLLCETGMNAFAYASPIGLEPELDFIGINIGVIYTFLDVFGRILAHPANFPDVGNPGLEVATIHNLPFLTTDVMKSGFESIEPNCPVRAIFAGELAQVAMDYLFFHELTHLRNGHLELIRNRFSLIHWPEAIGNVGIDDERKIRQTLEMDADSGAILHTLNAAFRIKDMWTSPLKSAPRDLLAAMVFAYGSTERAVRIVNFSAYILFRIFNTTEWLWEHQANLMHPPILFRMFAVGDTLYEIFRQRPEYGYNAEAFAKDTLDTIVAAETACGLIRGDQPDIRGINSTLRDRKYLIYLAELKINWSDIRPQLEIYKRGGKLAP
jgi:hypothetical protein